MLGQVSEVVSKFFQFNLFGFHALKHWLSPRVFVGFHIVFVPSILDRSVFFSLRIKGNVLSLNGKNFINKSQSRWMQALKSLWLHTSKKNTHIYMFSTFKTQLCCLLTKHDKTQTPWVLNVTKNPWVAGQASSKASTRHPSKGSGEYRSLQPGQTIQQAQRGFGVLKGQF